jgi:glycerophosphoryl diester phosphodiesterase
MKRIAHRGLSARYPENTLLAFQKAIEAKADGIETDLMLSADDVIILFHDDNLKRMTGKDAKPESLSLKALRTLQVGGTEQIPTLDELLALTNAKCTLILEIKYHPKNYQKLCNILVEKIKDKNTWIEVSCFEDKVLNYIHTLNPMIRLHKLIEDKDVLQSQSFDTKYKYIHYLDIDVALRREVLALDLMAKYKVIFWTVEKENLEKEIQAGLYGIMLNDVSV